MELTEFAGLTQLDPGESLATGGWAFQGIDRATIDALLRVGAITHRHDAHTALPDPTADPVAATDAAGGQIPSGTSIYVGYTLVDADGGETALNDSPQLVTTQAGLVTPATPPTLALDHAAGTLLSGTYRYALTVTDGQGGETPLGPSASIVIPPGNAVNEVTASGLQAIVTASGGTGWRLWRSINGGPWTVYAASATDTYLDDGSGCADCGQTPPTTVASTNATNTLRVTVPTGQDPAATAYRIYASPDGSFGNPCLLGQYDIATAGVEQTYTTLDLLDGAPPQITRALPGATRIDALTEIDNLSWKPPVATINDLPVAGNADGDARATLDDHKLHVWDATGQVWTTIGSGLALMVNGMTQPEEPLLALGQGRGITVTATDSPGSSIIVTIADSDLGQNVRAADILQAGVATPDEFHDIVYSTFNGQLYVTTHGGYFYGLGTDGVFQRRRAWASSGFGALAPASVNSRYDQLIYNAGLVTIVQGTIDDPSVTIDNESGAGVVPAGALLLADWITQGTTAVGPRDRRTFARGAGAVLAVADASTTEQTYQELGQVAIEAAGVPVEVTVVGKLTGTGATASLVLGMDGTATDDTVLPAHSVASGDLYVQRTEIFTPAAGRHTFGVFVMSDTAAQAAAIAGLQLSVRERFDYRNHG